MQFNIESPTEAFELIGGRTHEPLSEIHESDQKIVESPIESVSSSFSCEELADMFNTTTRTIQKRLAKVREAYPWLDESRFRVKEGRAVRYSPLAVDALSEMENRAAGTSESDWVRSVHEAHPDEHQAWVEEFSAVKVEAEIVDEADAMTPNGEEADSTSASSQQNGIIVRDSQQTIAVNEVQTLNVTVINTSHTVQSALGSVDQALERWVRNSRTADQGLIQNARQQGAEVGVQVGIAKVEGIVETSQQVQDAMLQQLGLVGKQEAAVDAAQDLAFQQQGKSQDSGSASQERSPS